MKDSKPSVSRDLFDQVMVPNYSPAKIIPVRGQGSRLWDQDGRDYIDFVAGIAVNALGHSHPRLVQTLKDQGEKLWHLANIMTNEPALRLAARLCELTFAEKVFFCNSGAEANEAALKLARRYAYDHYGEQKHEIISTLNSFHGRTLFTVSVGGQAKYKQGFEPTPGGISHVPYNDIAAMEAAISDKTCAVIIEPVQGEGGVHPAKEGYLEAVKALCEKHNALLIFDEIQTGMGRSGKLFAYEKYGVVPDILTSAKALGCGFPIGAMLTTDKIAASFTVGTHGSTFGGNALACAVSEVAVELLSDPELLQHVETTAAKLTSRLQALGEQYGMFQDIRNCGLLIGCEMSPAYQDRAKDLVNIGHTEGVMLHVAGPNVLRLLPPLNMTDEELEEGLQRIANAMAKMAG
ncbi:acetylornithine/succinyldiaminopimelate transaminase [Gynuella sunshinyii]|uniref:Acetylornithine aminotransferase n=1 Tax=Gynuella sunshinyii YC6258 TaxID=1445510 RepID=A0A0C5VSG4_9GAMM|nr:acetylornithine/succinyldiaminopimelate transaminase [Gynuella sunshinyii]AJQ97632.1 ornithine/acetylornithine aminotransferase [Gynuella sunshinyii YC6258]